MKVWFALQKTRYACFDSAFAQTVTAIKTSPDLVIGNPPKKKQKKNTWVSPVGSYQLLRTSC